MNKLILLAILCAISSLALAQVKTFTPQEKIKAADVNTNFSYIKSILSLKDITIPFQTFSAGELITKEKLEQEFGRIRALNIEVPALSSEKIKASELNNSFSLMHSGVLSYNTAPVLHLGSLSTDINTPGQVVLSVTNYEDDPLFYNVVAQGSKGAASTIDGHLVYTPALNQYGTDSFQLRVGDGELYSNTITVSVIITGKGIVENSGVRTYFDATVQKSCEDYLKTNSGTKTYWGKTGNGVYKIQSGAETVNVYCDMETDGGGWTLALRIGDMNAPANLSTGAVNSNSLDNPLVVGIGAGFYSKLSDTMINAIRTKSSTKAGYRLEAISSSFISFTPGRKLFYPGSCHWVQKDRYIQSTYPECTKRSYDYNANSFTNGADTNWCNQNNMTRHYFCSGAGEGLLVVTGWEPYPWHNWPNHRLWVR